MFEQNLKYLRKQHGVTQKQLGEILGVSDTSIRRYERGDIQGVTFDSLIKLADHFDVLIDDLIRKDLTK